MYEAEKPLSYYLSLLGIPAGVVWSGHFATLREFDYPANRATVEYGDGTMVDCLLSEVKEAASSKYETSFTTKIDGPHLFLYDMCVAGAERSGATEIRVTVTAEIPRKTQQGPQTRPTYELVWPKPPR